MRVALLVVPFLLAVCGAAAADGPAAVKRKHPHASEISRFDGYKIAGLTLWRVTMPSMADRTGDRFLVGVDGKGGLVEGAELFKLAAPGLPPADVVRRAFDLLLGRMGGEALERGDQLSLGSAAEKALVMPPALEGGVITFWFYRGEMAPQITRGQLTVATGELALRSAGDVLHPPEAALPGIRALLHDGDAAKVKDGLNKVSEWKELAPDVEDVLAHPDPQVRSMAISVLSNLHLPRSIPALIAMLDRGPEWSDRSLAAQALLWRFGTPEAVAAVRARQARATELNEVVVLRDILKDYDAGKKY